MTLRRVSSLWSKAVSDTKRSGYPPGSLTPRNKRLRLHHVFTSPEKILNLSFRPRGALSARRGRLRWNRLRNLVRNRLERLQIGEQRLQIAVRQRRHTGPRHLQLREKISAWLEEQSEPTAVCYATDLATVVHFLAQELSSRGLSLKTH